MSTIMGFAYQRCEYPAFDVIGFSKLVRSGGELFEETRADGRWEALKGMNAVDQNIYCLASFDRECTEGRYRYTIGVAHDENYVENPTYINQLFSLHVKQSDWIVFTLDFEADYGVFWQKDPYQMISALGCSFNNTVGLHLDVFSATYDGHAMAFWMPVK